MNKKPCLVWGLLLCILVVWSILLYQVTHAESHEDQKPPSLDPRLREQFLVLKREQDRLYQRIREATQRVNMQSALLRGKKESEGALQEKAGPGLSADEWREKLETALQHQDFESALQAFLKWFCQLKKEEYPSALNYLARLGLLGTQIGRKEAILSFVKNFPQLLTLFTHEEIRHFLEDLSLSDPSKESLIPEKAREMVKDISLFGLMVMGKLDDSKLLQLLDREKTASVHGPESDLLSEYLSSTKQLNDKPILEKMISLLESKISILSSTSDDTMRPILEALSDSIPGMDESAKEILREQFPRLNLLEQQKVKGDDWNRPVFDEIRFQLNPPQAGIYLRQFNFSLLVLSPEVEKKLQEQGSSITKSGDYLKQFTQESRSQGNSNFLLLTQVKDQPLDSSETITKLLNQLSQSDPYELIPMTYYGGGDAVQGGTYHNVQMFSFHVQYLLETYPFLPKK